MSMMVLTRSAVVIFGLLIFQEIQPSFSRSILTRWVYASPNSGISVHSQPVSRVIVSNAKKHYLKSMNKNVARIQELLANGNPENTIKRVQHIIGPTRRANSISIARKAAPMHPKPIMNKLQLAGVPSRSLRPSGKMHGPQISHVFWKRHPFSVSPHSLRVPSHTSINSNMNPNVNSIHEQPDFSYHKMRAPFEMHDSIRKPVIDNSRHIRPQNMMSRIMSIRDNNKGKIPLSRCHTQVSNEEDAMCFHVAVKLLGFNKISEVDHD